MNETINYTMINNLHKELNESLSYLFKNSKYNNKNNNSKNKIQKKSILSKIMFIKLKEKKMNSKEKENPNNINNINNSFINNRKSSIQSSTKRNIREKLLKKSNNNFNEQKNHNEIDRRMSYSNYLFDHYTINDVTDRTYFETSKRSKSKIDQIIKEIETKIANKKDSKENGLGQEEAQNKKNNITFCKSNSSQLLNSVYSIKKSNLLLQKDNGNKSKEKNIIVNPKEIININNSKIKNEKEDNNKSNNNYINLNNLIQKLEAKPSKTRCTKIEKEKKNVLKYLSIINIDSIMGSGNFESKSNNQDSIFTLTNNNFMSINNNKISNFNLFTEGSNQTLEEAYTFLGICDGHGEQGKTISNYISNTIPLKIQKFLKKTSIKITKENLDTEIIPNINLIFNDVNMTLNTMQSIDTICSGSCFCSLFITPTSIISINLGNSRAIIGVEKIEIKKEKEERKRRRKIKEKPKEKIVFVPESVTFEHTLENIKEKERIIENGGKIYREKDQYDREFGPKKLKKENSFLPGLLITRSLGDKEAGSIGVISEPDVQYIEMKNEYKFIVIGSKGFWEFISNEECAKIIGIYYLKNDISGALTHIINIAKSRWIEEHEAIFEDISVIIGFIKEINY